MEEVIGGETALGQSKPLVTLLMYGAHSGENTEFTRFRPLDHEQYFGINQAVNGAFRKTVGTVMEVIEVLGLPEKQEEALKRQLKSVIWDQQDYFNKNFDEVVDKQDLESYYEEQRRKMGALGVPTLTPPVVK